MSCSAPGCRLAALVLTLAALPLTSCAAPASPPPAAATPPAATAPAAPEPAAYQRASARRGGLLYDRFWAESARAVARPEGSNPGYALTSGKQKGPGTFRCKECHGWDYLGRDGAYAKGSHRTGAPGLMGARRKSPEELFRLIRQGKPGTAMTSYAALLTEEETWDLVRLIREGLLDLRGQDVAGDLVARGADAGRGRALYAASCASARCHGDDGKAINFHAPHGKEYVGTVARQNPAEFVHKIRFGHPGSTMPGFAFEKGWTLPQILDVLVHSRTLEE